MFVFDLLADVLVVMLEYLMVLEEVKFVSGGQQRLLINVLNVLGFMVFYFEQMVEFFFGLVYALLEC